MVPVLALDSGVAGIWVGALAIIPGVGALWVSLRNERRRREAEADALAAKTHVDQEDVFVKRDAAAWNRILDALAATQKEAADLRDQMRDLRIDHEVRGRELDGVHAQLDEATAHARRCDTELAALKARFDERGS